jgi:hypothetical protein
LHIYFDILLEVVISLSKLKTTSKFLAGQWLVNGWSKRPARTAKTCWSFCCSLAVQFFMIFIQIMKDYKLTNFMMLNGCSISKMRGGGCRIPSLFLNPFQLN